jgi:hypothetical protein
MSLNKHIIIGCLLNAPPLEAGMKAGAGTDQMESDQGCQTSESDEGCDEIQDAEIWVFSGKNQILAFFGTITTRG